MSIVVSSTGRSHEQTCYLYVEELIENTENQKKIGIGRTCGISIITSKTTWKAHAGPITAIVKEKVATIYIGVNRYLDILKT